MNFRSQASIGTTTHKRVQSRNKKLVENLVNTDVFDINENVVTHNNLHRAKLISKDEQLGAVQGFRSPDRGKKKMLK